MGRKNKAKRNQGKVIKSLPKKFIDWQVKSRYKTIKMLKKGKGISSFGVHTPVMATYNKSTKIYGTSFDINLAAKGVGLIVKKEFIKESLDNLDILNSQTGNMDARLEFLLDFYSDPAKLDDTCLTTLEIYATQTLENVKSDYNCSLLFVDISKKITSYQVNCTVELMSPNTDVYKFVNGLHTLFHGKISPPYAYKLNVCELYDKGTGKTKDERKLL